MLKDFLNLPNVQFLIKYWYIYLLIYASITTIAVMLEIVNYRKQVKKINNKYDKFQKKL